MRQPFLHDISRRQRELEPGVIIGMKRIRYYTKMGYYTLKKLYQQHGFPLAILPDGRWCTTRNLVDEWVLARWKAQQQAARQPAQPEEASQA